MPQSKHRRKGKDRPRVQPVRYLDEIWVKPSSEWDPEKAAPILRSLHRIFGAEPPGGWSLIQLLQACEDAGFT
jgi:hypothetical protein